MNLKLSSHDIVLGSVQSGDQNLLDSCLRTFDDIQIELDRHVGIVTLITHVHSVCNVTVVVVKIRNRAVFILNLCDVQDRAHLEPLDLLYLLIREDCVSGDLKTAVEPLLTLDDCVCDNCLFVLCGTGLYILNDRIGDYYIDISVCLIIGYKSTDIGTQLLHVQISCVEE